MMMSNSKITTFPFFSISDLLNYFISKKIYNPNIIVDIPHVQSTLHNSQFKSKYYLKDKVFEYLGYCTNNYSHVFMSEKDDKKEYWSTGFYNRVDNHNSCITESELEPELIYLFTIYEGAVHNINIDFLLGSNSRNSLDFTTGYENLPYLSLVVGEDIRGYGGSRYTACSNKSSYFKYSFGHELVWSNVVYPMQIISADSIELTLFNSPETSIPYPLATSNSNKFIVLNTKQGLTKSCYIGGTTTYLEDYNQLDALRYILLQFAYKHSKVNSKYDYLSVSINHSKFAIDRVIVSKHKVKPAYNKSFDNIIFNLGKTFESLKIPKSKHILQLEKSIEKWLGFYNLYTEELSVSNYLVTIKDDYIFRVTTYLELHHDLYNQFDVIPNLLK